MTNTNKNSGAILVVDDDAELNELLAELLSESVERVEVAKTVDEALALLRTQKFDAILSDIYMPGATGVDLLVAVRGMNLKTPVVMLTGSSSETLILQALRLGAFDFIQKPSGGDELIAVMRRAAEYGRRQAQLDEAYAKLPRAVGDHDLGSQIERDERVLNLLRLVNHKDVKK